MKHWHHRLVLEEAFWSVNSIPVSNAVEWVIEIAIVNFASSGALFLKLEICGIKQV